LAMGGGGRKKYLWRETEEGEDGDLRWWLPLCGCLGQADCR
jgi:hypothetical protein